MIETKFIKEILKFCIISKRKHL